MGHKDIITVNVKIMHNSMDNAEAAVKKLFFWLILPS